MRYFRLTMALTPYVLLVAICAGVSDAQQIYRWTDERGKTHFGNSPPPDAKDIQAKDRAHSQAELDCEGAARRQCRRDLNMLDSVFDDVPTTLIRECMAEYTRNCANFSKPKPPGTAVQRTLVTARLRFDPTAGERLVCSMTCPTKCTGSVEIWDVDNLARGENPGAPEYSVRVTPTSAGSAYCRSTTTDTGGTIVLNLMRGDAVVASARAN